MCNLRIFYSSDAANITAFAAGLDKPVLFHGDEILNDTSNFKFYHIFQLPLTIFISKFTGNYVSAFLLPLGLLIFIQGLGFYVLGKLLFNDEFWAFLLSLATLAPVPIFLGDFWGIYFEPLPRVYFQAFFPFFLALFVYWRLDPKKWFILFFLSWFMVYIHPPSVLSLGTMLWVGSWLYLPRFWKVRKKIGFMAGLLVLFILPGLPFLSNYLSSHLHGGLTQYKAIMDIMKVRFLKGFLDIPFAFLCFVSNLTVLRVMIFGLIGYLFLYFFQKKLRKETGLVLVWILALFFISFFIPYLEQLCCQTFNLIPFEIDLVRAARYIFPLLIIFCIWPAVVFRQPQFSNRLRLSVFFVFTALILSWCLRQGFKHVGFLRSSGLTLLSERSSKMLDEIDMLDAIKKYTPEGAAIFAYSLPHELAVRYDALRPLVFSYKDGGAFAYSNEKGLLDWFSKLKKVNTVGKEKNPEQKANLLLGIAAGFGADYLVTEKKLFWYIPSSTVYTNGNYILIKIGKGDTYGSG